MKPFNIETPDWSLLEHAVQQAGLPAIVCDEFMWMGEWIDGQHCYKHRDTRRYVKLTSLTPHPQILVKEARLMKCLPVGSKQPDAWQSFCNVMDGVHREQAKLRRNLHYDRRSIQYES